MNLFLNTAVSILVISNCNSFQCCLIKLLPCILFEKYIHILALEMASPGNQQLYQLYRHTFVRSTDGT